MERGRTVFILSCLLGHPGVTHALFYAMNGEHDRVDVTIALYIYIKRESESLLSSSFAVFAFPHYLVEAAE